MDTVTGGLGAVNSLDFKTPNNENKIGVLNNGK